MPCQLSLVGVLETLNILGRFAGPPGGAACRSLEYLAIIFDQKILQDSLL